MKQTGGLVSSLIIGSIALIIAGAYLSNAGLLDMGYSMLIGTLLGIVALVIIVIFVAIVDG